MRLRKFEYTKKTTTNNKKQKKMNKITIILIIYIISKYKIYQIKNYYRAKLYT